MSMVMRGIRGFSSLATVGALFFQPSSKQEDLVSRTERVRESQWDSRPKNFKYVGDLYSGERRIQDPQALKDLAGRCFVRCTPNRYITGTTDFSSCAILQGQIELLVANLKNNCCKWNGDLSREELEMACFDCQRTLDEEARRKSGTSIYRIQ